MSDVSERFPVRGTRPAAVDPVVLEGRAETVATPARPAYGGLVTRTIALVIDAAVIDAVAALVGVAIGLVVSLLPSSGKHKTTLLAIGVGLFFAWAAAYFVVFWSTTGQTPGSRLMRIRVVATGERKLGVARAALRVVALVAGIIPLGAGELPILFTERRRALQDYAAGTVVVNAPVARSR